MSLLYSSLKTFPNILSMIPIIHIPVARTHRQKRSKWSMEIPTRNLVPNPNCNRILLDAPDYSFLDKRPAPYNSAQYKRICLQKEYTKKIIDLTNEIKLGQQLYKERQQQKIDEEQKVLSRKLIKKGGIIKE